MSDIPSLKRTPTLSYVNNPECRPVLRSLPLGEGGGEGWRPVLRAVVVCSLLALTPTLSQRARGQEKPNNKKDTHVNYPECRPVLRSLPLGEGGGEGWRFVHRAVVVCGLLALTQPSPRGRGGKKSGLHADGFSLDKSQLQLGFDQHERIKKGRQVALDREPDDFQVNLEITMRKGVAHFISVDQRQGQGYWLINSGNHRAMLLLASPMTSKFRITASCISWLDRKLISSTSSQ
jgi:hypothetical protein